MKNDQLFYDGQCPLCVAEMDKLRTLADGGLDLVDIHTTDEELDLPEREALLGTLHLRRKEGGFLVGMDANVAAWQHTRYGWLWRPLRWPLIRHSPMPATAPGRAGATGASTAETLREFE